MSKKNEFSYSKSLSRNVRNVRKMFPLLFIDFCLEERDESIQNVMWKKTVSQRDQPFLFIRYAFVTDLATVLTRNLRLLLMKYLMKGEAVIWANKLIKNRNYF